MRVLRTVLVVFLTVVISSCTVVDCSDPFVKARFVGFTKNELERVEIIRYHKGTRTTFDTAMEGYIADTINYNTVPLDDYKDYDFLIKVLNTGDTFLMTSLRAKQRKYNYGLMSMAALCSNPILYHVNSVPMKVEGENFCEYNYCHTFIGLIK